LKEKVVETFIYVKDTGIGISAQDLSTLFDPYFKSKDERSQNINQNSHGLGLHISKRIAQNLGGDLKVESKYGEGTTFCLKLYLDKPQKVV
jgi:signal transduction histidine kinase